MGQRANDRSVERDVLKDKVTGAGRELLGRPGEELHSKHTGQNRRPVDRVVCQKSHLGGVERDLRLEALPTLVEGDRVVFQYFYPCMQCPTCLKGHTYACPVRQADRATSSDEWPHFKGTFAEYYYLQPNHAMFKVPDSLTDDEVAGINCALSQVISGLDRAGLSFGETVTIQGAGGLGVYAAGVAKMRGASHVIAIDGVDERLELIKDFGADDVIDIREYDTPESRVNAVRDLTNGLGTDVTLELVGHPGVVAEGLDMTAQAGRYLEIGNINVGWETQFDPSVIVFKNISMIGIAHYRAEDLKNALDFLIESKNRLPFDRVLSHQFPLSKIDDAMEQQNAGHITRAALMPGS